MSDKEARALGAGDAIEVRGKEYLISPVSMKQLHEVQRAAVAYYKREYLRTYADNMDLLPKGRATSLMEQKIEEVAHWDIGNLPTKLAYDVRHIDMSGDLLKCLENEYGDLPENELTKRALLATMLDSNKITLDEIQKMCGSRPKRAKVPYDTWWVTAVFDGMITFVWTSVIIKHPEVMKDDVGMWPLQKLVEAARMVERLTAPTMGNM